MFYSNPYARQMPASFQPSSRPSYQPEVVTPTHDDLARARYIRVVQEQRAARQAYTDALAERDVQNLEHGYTNNPYVRMNRPTIPSPRVDPFPTRDDEETDTSSGFDCDQADALHQHHSQPQFTGPERHHHQARTIEERQRLAALKDEASRRAVNEARLARQMAYDAEQRALQEEQSRRAARYRTDREQVSWSQGEPRCTFDSSLGQDEPTRITITASLKASDNFGRGNTLQKAHEHTCPS